MHDDARDVVRSESVGMALDPHVLESVGGVPRFEHFAVTTRRHHAIDLSDRERGAAGEVAAGEVVLRDIAGGIERLAVHERQLRAGRAEVGEPYPPVDVLAEVDDLTIGVDAADAGRSQLLDATHRW